VNDAKANPVSDADALEREIKAAGNIPRHVAVIMDGNGRWASRRRLPRVAGHRAGRHAVRRTVAACLRLGVDVLTLYTFSQENWKRPEAEVKALWMFLQEVLGSEIEELRQQGVRLTAIGDLEAIPERARQALLDACDLLADNSKLTLNLALAYGGRAEIVRAARRAAERVARGELAPDQVDEDVLRAGLDSPDLPDPDLVIRTSGEYRLSNFLIWQSAYAEMYFTPTLWPDFDEAEFFRAVRDFQGRERRFGALGDSTAPAAVRGSLLDPARWKRLLKVRS